MFAPKKPFEKTSNCKSLLHIAIDEVDIHGLLEI